MAKQIPSREKFRKTFKLLTEDLPKASRNVEFAFGDYGLRCLENARLTEKQLEALRKAVTKEMQRKGTVVKRAFPHHPYTKKPIAVRMGKGKGPVEGHAAVVLAGQIILEIDGVDKDVAFTALSKGSYKLPFKTKIISRYL